MRKGPTPEQLADWAEARRRMEAILAKLEARAAAEKEREERRRRRLHHLSFGLLGRSAPL
jgi:hypothetical protein